MTTSIDELTAIARQLHNRLGLEVILQVVVDGASKVLAAPRASLRLLDPSQTRLIAACRAGSAQHHDPSMGFRLGEGLVGWIAEHAQPLRTGHAESDPRFVARPGMKEHMGSFLGVPLLAGARCMGVLSAVHPETDHFSAEHEQLAVLLATIAAPHIEIARLSRLTRVDSLTGTLNRRGLDDAFPEVAQPAASDGASLPLSLALVDIDHFKLVNDQYGHAVGDEVLRAVTERLAGAVRLSDAVVRYGGEEFLLILPSLALRDARRVADRARRTIARVPVKVAGVVVPVTVSVGVAERVGNETREALIARADAAMYEAKRRGRNRTEAAS
jgi:diguanylate cyclase (GGDEF)-like protein